MLAISASNACLTVVLLVISYLIGSIPNGLVVGRLFKGVDIREYGSKNIGTTNSVRVMGKKLGYFVFVLDVLKGICILVLVKILRATGAWETPIPEFFYGLAAIAGHFFPIYLNFKGGKGVATSFGVVLLCTPIPAVACAILFAIILFTTGYVSLGSTIAAITVVVSAWILYACGVEPTSFGTYLIGAPALSVAIAYTLLAGLICFKHKKNYQRLLNGTENSFKKKKTQ